jgi:glycosyltransferase involved in cell wall biosynthesis
MPFPVDLDGLVHKNRKIVNKFIFINGNGGWRGRKGWTVIEEMLKNWKDCPIKIYSQYPISATYETAKNIKDLYSDGDVLLCPHSVDGLCLEMFEAMASGIPVIATDGQPWNEIPTLAKIKASKIKRKIKRMVDWYEPVAKDLEFICRNLMYNKIGGFSAFVRKKMEERSWQNLKKDWEQILC